MGMDIDPMLQCIKQLFNPCAIRWIVLHALIPSVTMLCIVCNAYNVRSLWLSLSFTTCSQSHRGTQTRSARYACADAFV